MIAIFTSGERRLGFKCVEDDARVLQFCGSTFVRTGERVAVGVGGYGGEAFEQAREDIGKAMTETRV